MKQQEETLRSQYNSLAHHLRRLQSFCVNCGTSENIEYHHIVPLSRGGSNAMSNIVPLCTKCHKKAHDQEYHKTDGIRYGRPKKMPPMGYEEVLEAYFSLRIGKAEMMDRLGITDHRTSQIWWIKEYRKNHDIPEGFRNNIDVKMWRNRK